MANDQRDYVIDSIKKRTHYTEKAGFRVNLGEQKRQLQASKKRQRRLILTVCITIIMAVIIAIINKIIT